MKAVIWTNYGGPDVLQLQETEKPKPKNNEVLIKIHAATVTAGDCEIRSLKIPMMLGLPMRLFTGLRKPKGFKILGQEMSGIVEETGKNVRLFKKGDEVFGTTISGMGAYAEYICLPEESEESMLALKPVNIELKKAACLPTGSLEALRYLRSGKIKKGQYILINGAGGTIGTYTVQLAKYFGAQVTAVDSAEKLEMLKSIGADFVIDYKKEDFTKNNKHYDIIFDIPRKSSYSRCLKSLNKKGYYLVGNPSLPLALRSLFTNAFNSRKVLFIPTEEKTEDLVTIKELTEKGIIKPVIDKYFSLKDCSSAHKYVESGHKRGNVIIEVTED